MSRSTDSSPPDEGREPQYNVTAPPHNQEAEEAVLGTMLLSEKAIADSILAVSVDDFYRPVHRVIFDAIVAVYNRGQGKGVDPLTVFDFLEESEALESAGGAGYLVSLQSKAPVISHASRYASIVREHAVRRRMISVGGELAEGGRQPSATATDSLTDANNKLNELMLAMSGKERFTTSEHVGNAVEEMVQKWDGTSKKGALTGLKSLDQFTDGLHRGRFYILGARPGQGKSVLATNIATEFAVNQGKTVLFFSLEMSETEVAHRSLMSEAWLHNKDMEKGWLGHRDWLSIRDAERGYRESNLILDSTTGITLPQVEARCRQEAARTGGLDLVIIDYLGLMGVEGSAESRQMQIQGLSGRLKAVSREMDVPVLALSQLSRKIEERSPPRPRLSDLRESGSLEQDADCVMFLYRDEEHNEESEWGGFTELIMSKNRHGEKGSAYLAFIPEMYKFGNIATSA